MNLTDIRSALAEHLQVNIPGVRAFAEWRMTIPTGTDVTALVVRPAEDYVQYLDAMSRGLATVRVLVTAVVPMSDAVSAQRRLDELLSSGTGEVASIWDALRPTGAPQTLGGLVSDLLPISAGAPGELTIDGIDYLAADVEIEIKVVRT